MKEYIEALLFASPEPLTQTQVNGIFSGENINLNEIVSELNLDYKKAEKLIYIKQIANGYQILTKPDCHLYIQRLYNKSRKIQLTQPALEALSVIAYKQPISKIDIEYIRGVNSDSVVKTLLEKDLITIKGRENSPGRALLYGTTQAFLECFGLNKITDLPKLKELTELIGEGNIPTTLFDATE
tara:strand:- start:516 stop:1067 length:552 start_codon:yes stop_codon:yes gene_type:complete